jgi:hypothetical protein
MASAEQLFKDMHSMIAYRIGFFQHCTESLMHILYFYFFFFLDFLSFAFALTFFFFSVFFFLLFFLFDFFYFLVFFLFLGLLFIGLFLIFLFFCLQHVMPFFLLPLLARNVHPQPSSLLPLESPFCFFNLKPFPGIDNQGFYRSIAIIKKGCPRFEDDNKIFLKFRQDNFHFSCNGFVQPLFLFRHPAAFFA